MTAKLKKIILGSLPFLVSLAIVAALIFYPHGETPPLRLTVVRVWNVDTFEGGKGSRTSFLKRAAAVAEEAGGVYYLITSYTQEGAEAAFHNGERPDVLSFGIGFSAYAEESLPLPYACAGGKLGGDTLAVPWCRGAYYLFTNSKAGGAEETVLSVGGENLVEVAALKNGIAGKTAESLTAYTDFLAGKFRYLLGTQRDVCRFAARGAAVEMRELTAYNDLYQYISVLSAEKRTECLALVSALLSEQMQAALADIGMLPVGGDRSGQTVSVFTDSEALSALRQLASAGDEKNLDKFLKTV